MFKKLVPFNGQRHGNKKLRPVDNFKFAANSYLASLVVNEFSRASSVYPIVFLKDGSKENPEKFGVYALLGLRQGENLFVDEQGNWDAPYIPAIIRRYPFALGRSEAEGNNFLVCIDEESEFINETEGQPLTKEDGQPAEVVEKAKEYLSDLYKYGELTTRFCKDLADRELLTPLNMQIRDPHGGPSQSIGGCFGVNENKLNELSDQDFLELRKRGALPLIYAHLFSLPNMERLIRMQNEKPVESPMVG